ncbi:MAG: hypothetical protein EBR23_11955, partial [Planctomycetia bacterium]|nr:hypothetical protein [Planctomycetia bacterium]
EVTRARQPALRLDAAGAGQGATLAILGGFRALVADLAWIRMYAVWERRDLPGTETLLRLVTTICADRESLGMYLTLTRPACSAASMSWTSGAAVRDGPAATPNASAATAHANMARRDMGFLRERHKRGGDSGPPGKMPTDAKTDSSMTSDNGRGKSQRLARKIRL